MAQKAWLSGAEPEKRLIVKDIHYNELDVHSVSNIASIKLINQGSTQLEIQLFM